MDLRGWIQEFAGRFAQPARDVVVDLPGRSDGITGTDFPEPEHAPD